MTIIPMKCPAELHIDGINAMVECSYVGTRQTIEQHIKRGEHKSRLDLTGANCRYQIVWWTVNDGE